MAEITNWGRYLKVSGEEKRVERIEQLSEYIEKTSRFIPRGNGRCYGDSSLQKEILSTLGLNKFLNFDKEKGLLTCESGVLLKEILKVIVPNGFFLPVTPGTKFITIGGAVAANVHGKNHHKEGAISRYIIEMQIMIEDGSILDCSRSSNSSLFYQTIGGMGLTGIILSVTFELKRIETSYIKTKSIKAANLQQILEYFDKYKDYTYSVAWIDCLAKKENIGRSILMLGEHAKFFDLPEKISSPKKIHDDKSIVIPPYFPSFALNKYSINIFNWLYYNKFSAQEKNQIQHYNSYFYPLDKLSKWNRIYGKQGFVQYQFVLPFMNGRENLYNILEKISDAGCGSFLAVLKTFGEREENVSSLSFPTSGYTLALDFKVSKKVFVLLQELDKLVIEYGGKIYLAKDALLSAKTFRIMYPEQVIHAPKFNSLQSERLGI